MEKKTVTAERLATYLASNSIHYFLGSESDHIFVTNNSDVIENSKRKSAISMPVDGDRCLRVPATALPIDLTNQATFEEIVTNSSFRDMLLKKYLLICPAEKAFELLATPEAKELQESMNKTEMTLDALLGREKIEVEDRASAQALAERDLVDIDMTVQECMLNENYSNADRLSILRNAENTLTEKDWKYVFEKASEGEVKQFALSKLSK